MTSHAQSLDSQPEGESAVLLGIVANGLENVRIDHPGSAELDPRSIPEEVDFDARFGKWKERGAKANRDVIAEVVRREHAEHGLQIRHRDVPIDQQPLHLMEHRKMRRVGVIGTIDAPQRDDSNRRLSILHHANLNRAGLAAKQLAAFAPRSLRDLIWQLPDRNYPAGREPDDLREC